jgi:hypothetical protein
MVAGVDHGLRRLDLEVERWRCGPAAIEKKGIRSSEHIAIEFNMPFLFIELSLIFYFLKFIVIERRCEK